MLDQVEGRGMRAVIFDLDGTLVDSAPDIHAAANALLRSMGYQPLSLDTVRSFIGNGIPRLVERVMRASGIPVDAARHADLINRFEMLYGAAPADLTVPYPGVPAMMEALAARGMKLGVCTNKNEGLSRQVLEGVGLSACFGAVIGGDTLPVRKPDPAPFHACAKALGAQSCVYVGDSEVDAATGEAAKVPFGLFTEGYRKTAVALIPHSFSFSDYAALPALVDAAFPKDSAA
jgi:phosphoglycolate phosphatase